jgi:hypothetical protein
MIKSSECLQPLYNLLNDQLLDSGYIHMDETRVQVLKEPDKTAESLSYMWVRKTGGQEHPIILFDYASRRRTDVAASLLGDSCKLMITRVITVLGGKTASQHWAAWLMLVVNLSMRKKSALVPKGKSAKPIWRSP